MLTSFSCLKEIVQDINEQTSAVVGQCLVTSSWLSSIQQLAIPGVAGENARKMQMFMK